MAPKRSSRSVTKITLHFHLSACSGAAWSCRSRGRLMTTVKLSAETFENLWMNLSTAFETSGPLHLISWRSLPGLTKMSVFVSDTLCFSLQAALLSSTSSSMIALLYSSLSQMLLPVASCLCDLLRL